MICRECYSNIEEEGYCILCDHTSTKEISPGSEKDSGIGTHHPDGNCPNIG